MLVSVGWVGLGLVVAGWLLFFWDGALGHQGEPCQPTTNCAAGL